MTTTTLPITAAGASPIPATSLLAGVIATVQSESPDYTSNLPGILIEDVSSTVVAAIAQIDQARVDAINSLTSYSANPFILAQLGVLFGLPQGTPTNTSCFVVFYGPAGYYIPSGFLVSDGSNQYVVQDGGAIQTNGQTQPLYVVAINPGSFAIPIGTINQLGTSIPAGYTITVNNLVAGVAGGVAESVESFRARMMQAQVAAAQGTPAYLLSKLSAVNGVISRLTTILQTTLGWKVICGGGDPYAVAGAIYSSVLDLASIIGSANSARNINVTLTDYPNNYNVVYVNPPQQIVGVSVLWNTVLTNFTAIAQVNQSGQAAVLNYINSIPVGNPLNEFALISAFQQGVSSVLPINYLTTLTFAITVNGIAVTPNAGTGLITTDSESYFESLVTGITVAQG